MKAVLLLRDPMRMSGLIVGATLLGVTLATPCASQDDVLPITSARVTQFIQGLAAEKPVWAKVKAMEDSADAASEAGVKALEKGQQQRSKYLEYQSCSERFATPMPADVTQHAMRVNQKLMTLNEQQQAAFQRQSDALEKAAETAAKGGDRTTAEAVRKAWRAEIARITGIPVAELEAGDTKMRAWSEQNDARVEKNCGPEPENPGDFEEAAAGHARSDRSEGVTDAIDKLGEQAGLVGAKASGMSPKQYAILRERVIAFIAADGDAERFGAYKFTDAELAVLRQRRAEIARHADVLDRTLSWNFDG